MSKSKVTLVEGMQFVGTADSGHALIMDAPLSVGGRNTGPTPMELLLQALAGCTGMDVISILRKKKQHVGKLEIHVTGETAEHYPKAYTRITLKYRISGKEVSEDAVRRAIALSMDKYCSVGATLGKSAEITHSYEIHNE